MNSCSRSQLDLSCRASQTQNMAHSYIRLDFGTDEEKAQQARHKLDGWRQAFRLDKKLQYKLDRPDSAPVETISKPEPAAKAAPPEKSKGRAAEKTKAKELSGKSSAPPPEKAAAFRVKKKQPRPPMGKSACWSVCIFLHTKSFPNNAGCTAFRPKSLSRAHRQKSFITATRNSRRPTSNLRLWRERPLGTMGQIAIRGQIGWKSRDTKSGFGTQFGLSVTQIRYN